MIDPGQLLAFAVASFVIIVIPGPSVLFVVGRALSLGRGGALASVFGNALGEYVLAAAVAVGLGTLMSQSIALFTVVKLAGAGYLIYLGIQAFRKRGSMVVETGETAARSHRKTLLEGFVVGVSNPKSVVFFAAVLPQFVNQAAPVVPQLLVLGLLFTALALLCDACWAFAAGTARDWLGSSPRRLRLLGGAGGISMIGLGVGLALTGRDD